jgi:L-alanine-DL-glutamate epimerase-like enolase superfamily enzyme
MKITGVQTVLLTGPCTHDPFLSECRRHRSAAFVEVLTDSGLAGLGESYNGYRCPELYPEAVNYFAPILLGRDVEDIPQLWRRMYQCEQFWCRSGFGLGVINGIEAALWDLKGKVEHKPVYELLGGLQHEALDAYATGGPSNYPKDRLAAKIDHYIGLGFRGVKLGTGLLTREGSEQPLEAQAAAALEAEKLTFVRDRYGPALTVCLDGHMGNRPEGAGQWDVDTAEAVCRAVEPFELAFFEEPLHYDDFEGYTELCRRARVPIAGGECLTGLTEWRLYIERDCFDIGQPDASFTGGLKLCVDIARLLEQRGRPVAMHAWGAGGSLMQNIHVGFACKNTNLLEIAPDYGPLHSAILGDSFRMRDGKVLPPAGPGLGITLPEEVKRRFPFIPGSGEFNDVPGRKLADCEERIDALLARRGLGPNWTRLEPRTGQAGQSGSAIAREGRP